MADELPILKGILNGVVNYHNAPVRFGRVPKREKARILAAMQQSSNSRSHEKAVTAELEDEQRLLATVVRAHLDTCDFTRDKVAPLLARARDQPSYTACPTTLACPLNPNTQPLAGQQELLQDFSKRFSPAIRGVVEFAKRIPGFSLLPQDDQVTLLKAGVFEVLLVRLACMFDAQTNSMICLNGQVLKRDAIHNSSNARFLMDSMFDFAERLNSLRLTDAEVGLFCSVVVIAPDRPGLRNTDLIERMQSKLRTALQVVIAQNHPGHPAVCVELMKKIPDLRTLNTLHSEKLLAFKMTEQQQQQQQQQQLQQQQMWTMADEDSASKSPPTSCSWSSGSDATLDEAKSPLGSVSSTESLCSGEVAAISAMEYPMSAQASSAPLLAATLAGGVCPVRHRAPSGSSGDEECPHKNQSHLLHHSLPPLHQSSGGANRFRRVESPSDSGIESGPEKNGSEKPAGGSPPTSVCSSPRSSLEDKDEDKSGHGNGHCVEDMPVLKRVLQAPPLYDTNSLMDEAYKPHKKFRALRNKDSAEAEAAPQLHLHLTQSPPAPSVVTATPSVPSNSSLSSTHSMLAKSLMESPRMTPEQMKRTDIIHSFIMRGSGSGPQPSGDASSLGDFPASTSPPASYARLAPPSPAGLLACAPGPSATPAYHYIPTPSQPQNLPHHPHHHHHTSPPQNPQRWGSPASNSPGVITTSCASRAQLQGSNPAPPTYLLALSPPQPSHVEASPEYPRIYFHAQPVATQMVTSVGSPLPHSSTSPTPAPARRSCSPTPSVPTPSAPSPRLVELQVDCIPDSQQPLNLSKKSPSPSPMAPITMEA